MFLRIVSGDIIAGLEDRGRKKQSHRRDNFKQFLDEELAKISGGNYTEFYQLFQFNALYKKLLDHSFTKNNSIIEIFVKLQITIGSFLQVNIYESPEIRELLEQMLIKTCSNSLLQQSRLLIIEPVTYITHHYKFFYLG
jgi:hypothetical protein